MAIDPRERELLRVVTDATKELRQLKSRQKNVANSGVTTVDIENAEKTIADAKSALKEFREERIKVLSTSGIKQAEQEYQDALAEQKDLKERSELGKELPVLGVGKASAPKRLVSPQDLDRAANKVDKKQKKLFALTGTEPETKEEVKADSGFEQPLTTTGGGGLRSAATPAVPGTIIVGLDVSADIDPARQAERKVLPGSQDGVFTINDPAFVGGEYLFLGTAGTAETFSKPVGYEQFEYGLYKMAPEEVISYKKALGYSNPTSVVDKKFKDDMLQAARTVSELNYGNAVAGKRVQASLEGYLSTPEKYGFAATGVKAGPSAEEVKVKADAIRIYATDLGVGLDDAAVNKLAREWAAGRFDTTTIKPQIARSGKIDFAKGSAAEQLNSLKELAGSFGMQYDEGWYNTAATNVLTGKDDIETYKQYVRDQAKSKFPTLVAQLDQGFTVRQLASPYIQTMSNILEIDPNTIGLNDVYVNQALTGLDAEGKPSTKPLWQFEQDLRKDPRWNFTKNAQDSLMNTTRKVLQDFGLVS